MLLGGMMAIDMGGPINKAAYVFGTASIASGNYDIMAAVMVGGIFVIGVISNPLGYLFALAVGSVVGMFGLALLKKPLK